MRNDNLKQHDEKKTGGVIAETILLLQFMKTMRVNRGYFALTIFFSFLAILFQVLNIQFLMVLLRGMIAHNYAFAKNIPVIKATIALLPETLGTSNSLFFVLLAAIFLSTLLKAVLQYAADLGVSYHVRCATSNLRALIFDRYLMFGKLFYDMASLGGLNAILVKFSLAISTQLNSLQKLISQVLSLIAYCGIMFFISWKLTLITLCVFPSFVLLAQWATSSLRRISRAQVKSEADLDKKIFSILSAMPLIKAHNTEEHEKRLFKDANEKEARLTFSLDKKEKLIQPIQELSMMVAFLVLACAVTFLLSEGQGRVSYYLVFFYLVRLSFPGFQAINQFRVALNRSSVRIKRIMEVFEDEEKFILNDGTQEFAGLEEAIELRHLNFSYNGEKQVLYDVSLSFEKGQTTAIVGPTGTGKTTLVHLLLRFYDCPEGTIFLDGRDIRDFTLKSLLRQMAYVSQDIFFFNNTICMNMTYGLNRPVDEEELIDVAKKARLYDLILQLPKRFDETIGDRGVQLSGGERQRLAIARALLRDAEVLILDEATSSLDSKTEKLVQEAITCATKGRTAIVVAHRLSTIRHADKIVVLEAGQVAEEGDLSTLLAKKGKFYEYWNEQEFF